MCVRRGPPRLPNVAVRREKGGWHLPADCGAHGRRHPGSASGRFNEGRPVFEAMGPLLNCKTTQCVQTPRNHLNNNPTGSQTLGRAPTPFPRAPPPALASPPATQPEPRRRAAQTAARAPADPGAQTAARTTAPATQGPRARAAPVGTNAAPAAKSLPAKTILFIGAMVMAPRTVLGGFFGPAAPRAVGGFSRPKNRRRRPAPGNGRRFFHTPRSTPHPICLEPAPIASDPLLE